MAHKSAATSFRQLIFRFLQFILGSNPKANHKFDLSAATPFFKASSLVGNVRYPMRTERISCTAYAEEHFQRNNAPSLCDSARYRQKPHKFTEISLQARSTSANHLKREFSQDLCAEKGCRMCDLAHRPLFLQFIFHLPKFSVVVVV